MEWLDTGFVLRIGQFREADLWIRLLTPQQGIITVFAFGGSRSRKRFCGCLGVLNELRVRIQTSRNSRFLNLQEASLLQGPITLRTNRNKFGVIINCIRFIEAIGVTLDAASNIYILLKELLSHIEGTIEQYEIIPILFRLRLASEQGYSPLFNTCSKCNSSIVDKGFFGVSDGQLVCPTCINHIKTPILLHYESMHLLQHVQQEAPSEWRLSVDTQIAAVQRYECTKIINAFIQYHLGIVWNKGKFCKV